MSLGLSAFISTLRLLLDQVNLGVLQATGLIIVCLYIAIIKNYYTGWGCGAEGADSRVDIGRNW